MNENALRRYTDLPVLHYLLRTSTLTLRDPRRWEDENDSYYLKVYQKRKKLRRVLALCFSQSDETSHHWKMFAPGNSGVCICFKRDSLVQVMERREGVEGRDVVYRTLREARKEFPRVDDLPFLKRVPYQGEEEFRVVFSSKSYRKTSLDIPISLGSIERIYLNPWIAQPLFVEVKQTLRLIPGCEKLKILRSTLMGNNEWKKFGDGAVD